MRTQDGHVGVLIPAVVMFLLLPGARAALEWAGVANTAGANAIASDELNGRAAADGDLTVVVDIELSPQTASGSVTRCICFNLYQEDPGADPTEVCQEITFTDGMALDVAVAVPPGTYSCITASDPLHTLTSTSDLTFDGDQYSASFVGIPFLGGNWLTGGNLDSFKESGHANVIDILDVAVFMTEVGTVYETGDTTCETPPPHADISADGVVDSLDWAFIVGNFFAESNEACNAGPRVGVLASGGSGWLISASSTVRSSPTSLCVVTQDGCHVVDSRVELTLELGDSDGIIVAGQFSIEYDPAVLDFIDIKPGSACAPTSPFTTEIWKSVDEGAGKIFYAVGVTPGGGAEGPETMACLSFTVRGSSPTEVCLINDYLNPTTLSDDMGQSVPIDNSGACPTGTMLALSCDDVEADGSCACAPDCSVYDGDCSVGVCIAPPHQCEPFPINEGGPCDDGNPCTITDTCINGECIGTDCMNPGLCVVAEESCLAVGEVDVTIELTEGVPVIIGGQFSIQYDPAKLELLAISPGRTCDASSPFSLEIHEDVNSVDGNIFYAIGVDFLGGGGTQGPATVACLTFATTGNVQSDVCLFNDAHPRATMLVDEFGDSVSVYNQEACPSDDPPPILSCDEVYVDEDCLCVPGTDDCDPLDTDCLVGVCNAETGKCETTPVNEGGPCDDGDSCTTTDICIEGECVGFGCTNQSLCVVAQEECVYRGQLGKVAIRLGAGVPLIVGGQFSIWYDAAALDFISISPGFACDSLSPFDLEIFETVDEVNGELFYAVGVPLGGTGTEGPTTIACLTFRVHEYSEDAICLFHNVNPFNTLLVDEFGEGVTIFNTEECRPDLPPPIASLCDEFCVHTLIPTVSEWGLIVMTLLLLVAAKIRFGHVAPRSV